MPPKAKLPKAPKSGSLRLSQVERKKASTQLHKQVPRTTCCAAGIDNTLLKVAELVLAASKQAVHFVNEDGSGMDNDGEGGDEGEGEGEGNGGGSGSDGGEEGNDEDTNPSRSNCKGCVVDSSGYTKAQEWIIVGGVQKYLPHGEMGWRKVGKYYNHQVTEQHQRGWERIKDKYSCMTKRKKPTGNGNGSKIHNAVLLLEQDRLLQEETVNINNNEWSDSDTPANNTNNAPPRSHVKSKPSPVPFGCSKSASSKSKANVWESDVIVIASSDNEAAPPPSTIPAKQKADPGTTYYAGKVPQVAEVKPKTNRHRDAQTTLDTIWTTLAKEHNNTSADAAGLAKVELFAHDCTIEQLKKDLSNVQKVCYRLQRQADHVTMIMSVYGIPLPGDASKGSGRLALGIALAGFLQTRFQVVVPPASALAAATAPPLGPIAFDDTDFPINPTLYNCTKEPGAPSLDTVPSGSNLSAIKKGKLPMYPGN